MNIVSLKALEILDSRGNPTLQTYVTLEDGTIGVASVPSGASTGSHESVELRDNQPDHYRGKSVDKARQAIHTDISHALVGMNCFKLDSLDKRLIELDGTPNKSRLGANTLLSVSLACARASSLSQRKPLWKTLHDFYFPLQKTSYPRIMVNVLNGGAHAHWVLDIQECMISPKERLPSASVEMASNVFHTLKDILERLGYASSVGDEGGFAPQLHSNSAAFDMLNEAIRSAGYSRETIDLATDIAASEMYQNGIYTLKKAHPHGESHFDTQGMIHYLSSLREQYELLSCEDPCAEDDWNGWQQWTKLHGSHSLVVGDDLYVTHIDRIQKGIETQASNAVLIKPNQVGTLYETAQAILRTKKAGWKVVISHRSGETADSSISDLAVACGADFIKAGSMSRYERLAKYNRLIEIEKIEM